jgi:hypothetical protein
MSERFPLSTLAGELRRQNLVKPPPTYRETYTAAVDGRIPAERGDNGRWSWTPADLPRIAAALRRTATDPQSA